MYLSCNASLFDRVFRQHHADAGAGNDAALVVHGMAAPGTPAQQNGTEEQEDLRSTKSWSDDLVDELVGAMSHARKLRLTIRADWGTLSLERWKAANYAEAEFGRAQGFIRSKVEPVVKADSDVEASVGSRTVVFFPTGSDDFYKLEDRTAGPGSLFPEAED